MNYLLLVLASLFSLAASDASAQTSGATGLEGAICAAYELVMNEVAVAASTLAIIAVGCAALMARVQWSTAITTLVGIGITFSAPNTVEVLTGTTPGCPGVTIIGTNPGGPIAPGGPCVSTDDERCAE